jgi:membrane protease subunit HflC
MRLPAVLALVGLALLLLLATMIYVVDEREQAVVLQFGKPVRETTEPGLYF